MTRSIVAVSASDPLEVMGTLRGALDRSGPALLPVAAEAPHNDVPLAAHHGSELHEVPHSAAAVLRTSGSTGLPKNVVLSCDALLASASASESVLGGPGQWLLALPAHYIAGLQVLVRSIAAETTPIVLPPGHFDTAAFIEASKQLTGELRFTSLVPAQLMRLLETRTGVTALRRFDGILIGGQALPEPVRERTQLLGLPVYRTYGSSETSGGCVYNGQPLPGVEMSIVSGQVELTGPVLSDGYLADDGTLDHARMEGAFVERDSRLWYRTGDLATIDDDVLTVLGRADNVIVSGGVNVNLDRVERIVRGVAGLGDAVVVGAEDDRWGQVPVVVTDVSGARLDVVQDAVATQLGKPARPNRIVTVAALPRLSSGKPDRQAITRAIAERTMA